MLSIIVFYPRLSLALLVFFEVHWILISCVEITIKAIFEQPRSARRLKNMH